MMPQQAAAARPTATPPTQYVGNMCVCVSLLCVCAWRACVCTHAQTNNRAASSLRNDFASGTCMIPSRNALRLLLRSRGTVCELCSPAKVVDCGIRSLQSSCEWLKAVPQANLSLHTGLLRAHGTRGFSRLSLLCPLLDHDTEPSYRGVCCVTKYCDMQKGILGATCKSDLCELLHLA